MVMTGMHLFECKDRENLLLQMPSHAMQVVVAGSAGRRRGSRPPHARLGLTGCISRSATKASSRFRRAFAGPPPNPGWDSACPWPRHRGIASQGTYRPTSTGESSTHLAILLPQPKAKGGKWEVAACRRVHGPGPDHWPSLADPPP